MCATRNANYGTHRADCPIAITDARKDTS